MFPLNLSCRIYYYDTDRINSELKAFIKSSTVYHVIKLLYKTGM